MEFKSRSSWQKGRSIVAKRRAGEGQVIWKGVATEGEDIFLVRVGKDASRQVTGTTDDALAALELLIDEVRGGRYVPATAEVRFETFLRQVLTEKRRRVKPSTYMTYLNDAEVRIIPALGGLRLNAIRPEHLQRWVDSLWDEGLKPKTIRNYVSLLRIAFRSASSLGLLASNPVGAVQLNSSTEGTWLLDPDEVAEEGGVSTERVWSQDEMRSFFEVAPCDHEITRWVLVGVRTGLRPQEQCGLRWVDVDWDASRLRVRGAVVQVDTERRAKYGRWAYGVAKTGQRDVSLAPDVIKVLRAQQRYVQQLLAETRITPSASRFVFPVRGDGSTRQGPKSRPKAYQSPDNIRDRLRHFILGRKGRASQTGLPGVRYICPYGMRHTHATDLIRHGWRTFVIAKRLGTSQTMIERHYGHWLPDIEPDITQMSPLPGHSLKS